jgi:hypothetical protein
MDAWPPLMQQISLHAAALLTFCIFSFLYRDNPFYKFAEYLVVGVSAGYYTVIFYDNYVKPNLVDHFLDPTYPNKIILLIPTLLGFMLWTRMIPKYAWLSRYSLAAYLGAAAGLAIPRTMETIILKQLSSTMVAPVNITDIVIIVGVLCTLIYFFFSKPHTGILGAGARVGVIFIMVSFGATFGYTVMARVSLLVGRVTFLIKDWLPALGIPT